MIKLTLDVNGKEKTYTVDKVKARVLKRGLEMFAKAEADNGSELELIDGMVDLVVLAFNNPEVTEDTIYDGLYTDEFFTTIQDVVSQIMGGMTVEVEGKGK